LARQEPRVAALQYAAAASTETDPEIMRRATEVTAETLQPSLMAGVAGRWIVLDPKSLEAQRAAARAALALYKIDESAAHYRVLISTSPQGADAEFAEMEADLLSDENIFAARQVADRVASYFPASPAALRVQGLTALRADDPAAAVRSLTAALTNDQGAHKDLSQTLQRARIMSGDVEEPLRSARAKLDVEDNAANRFDYAVLLMTAQHMPEATAQLEILSRNPESNAVALRLLGLLEFQQGHYENAEVIFRQLVKSGKLLDDGFYYLGLIADRNANAELALRFYAQVRGGENAVPALLRAAALLQTNGAPSAAEELFDKLIEDEPQRAPEIITARARMYAQSKELTKAFATLEQGMEEYPDNMDLRYATASVYEDEGQVDAALRELKQVLKTRPDDPAALNAFGFTLADHGKSLTRARRMIERAYAAAPKNAAILDSLGWVLFKQGHPFEALPYLSAAYADDRGGDIAAHLGEVLWTLGKPDEAERIWTEASLVDSDNRLLKLTRQRLRSAG
jgi:tetratricopeptide (TPR) repeat protein